jgi:endonuclease/exonuclease/phosphatase family metal-dependent hydrolase
VVKIEMFPGIEVRFASTHLDLTVENRMAQVNELIKISKQSKSPMILAGDLNSRPQSKEMQTLRQEFIFPCVSDCPLTSPSDKPRNTIDYIVLNPAAAKIFKVSDYKAINNLSASDHLPLTAQFTKK